MQYLKSLYTKNRYRVLRTHVRLHLKLQRRKESEQTLSDIIHVPTGEVLNLTENNYNKKESKEGGEEKEDMPATCSWRHALLDFGKGSRRSPYNNSALLQWIWNNPIHATLARSFRGTDARVSWHCSLYLRVDTSSLEPGKEHVKGTVGI